MMTKIIRELMATKKVYETTSQQVLWWSRRVEKALLNVTKENKEFDAIKTWPTDPCHRQYKRMYKMIQSNCRYYSNVPEPYRCPAYGKDCVKCDRANHFNQVCRSQSRKVWRDSRREKYWVDHSTCQDAEEMEVAK